MQKQGAIAESMLMTGEKFDIEGLQKRFSIHGNEDGKVDMIKFLVKGNGLTHKIKIKLAL
ncbi:hypothetical protein [Niallia endozanthoxylica]|uniref:Uncharacterized protein n=1 Tax=Niallia endozanthoxylica TaxID=2036016 RepID=A0A5J5HSW1_9BACI|nr:hypothetical protein [Niallia endozanthoxylica]KAA9023971.1 hypothetical protein F4V44_12630 [Niallia endozanthoxylica]